MRSTHGEDPARRRLRERLEREESKRWVHHVVDADRGGEPVTKVLDRPVTPLSRARQWERAGIRLPPDIIIFPPARRLTPRLDYEPGRAELIAHHCAAYSPAADEVVFGPYGFAGGPRLEPGAGIGASFYQVVPTQSLVTVRVSVYVTPGNTGLVTLTGWYTSVRYHLSGYGDHVLDLFTTPPDDYIIVLGMEVGDGITDLTFRELTFTTLPPVLEP